MKLKEKNIRKQNQNQITQIWEGIDKKMEVFELTRHKYLSIEQSKNVLKLVHRPSKVLIRRSQFQSVRSPAEQN